MEKILVADDNRQNCIILRDVLENWGYKVILAYSGSEVLELVEEESFEIILLDVMMPGLNGYEVCQELKKGTGTASTSYVILLTALNDVEDRILGYNVGADLFMTKPVNYHELQAVIKRVLLTRQEGLEKEPTMGVMNFLKIFLLKNGKDSILDQKLLKREKEYGKRLAQKFALSREDIQRINIALEFQELEFVVSLGGAMVDLKEALKSMNLAYWFIPMLTCEYTEKPQEDIGAEDIFLVVKEYGKLYKKRGEKPAAAIEALWEMAFQGKSSTLLVESLAHIVTNTKLLDSLS